MFKLIENVQSDEVWLFKCTNCGWHSDICYYPATNCLNCDNVITNLFVIIGTSAEMGEYITKELSHKL